MCDNMIRYTSLYLKAVQACLLIMNYKLYTSSIKGSFIQKPPLDTGCCADRVGSSMGFSFFLPTCKTHWRVQLAIVYDGNV